jgi:hypothetical protein
MRLGSILEDLEKRLRQGGFDVTRTGPAPAAVRTTMAPMAPRQLQQALRNLAAVSQDRALAVTADNRLGPRTVAAVNRALTAHVGPGQAPAGYRSGQLTPETIAARLPEIVSLISAEVDRRRGSRFRGADPTPAVPAGWIVLGAMVFSIGLGAFFLYNE